MIHFWLLSPAATHRHCRPYPILAKQVSGMRVDGELRRCVSESCSNKKRQTLKPAFIMYLLSDDYIFLKATQPLCPPNPNDVENAMLTSAFTATFGV